MVTQPENYKIQYEEEFIYQEINANKRTLKGFIWLLFAVAFVWVLTIIGFFEVDKQLTTIAFLSNLVLFLPSFYLLLKGDLSKPWIKYFLLTLLCVVSAVIISVLSYHAVLLYVFPLLYAIQYRKRRIVWFAYSVNLITILISSIVSFYYGICDLNILLQSQHVRDWYINTITDTSLNIPFNDNPLFVIIVFAVFPRSIILLVFSIMMQYTVNSNTTDALRIARLTYYKDIDLDTHVLNRNKYEEMLTDYYPGIDKVAVIFWDMNDLKKFNDQHGHATGDRVIRRFSSLLNIHADEHCRIYRVGGDEFIMIIDNPSSNEAETIISSVGELLVRTNENDSHKITCAVGLAFGNGRDIVEVIKEADAYMYENKRLVKAALQKE